MPDPLISICIPAYKAEKYLQAALDSVRAQTFADWELIVTEDGSKDRTEEIVQAFAQGVAQPVIYNRHEKNRGLPATRNTGIAAARGTWVAFLDADDLWAPTHLADLVAAAGQDNSYDLVYAGTSIFDDLTGAEIQVRTTTAENLAALPLALYTSRVVIQPSAAMVRRSALEKFGPVSEAYPICNDLELWLRIAAGGGKFNYTGRITCLYRKHGEAMSQKSAALIAEAARICEAYNQCTAIPARVRRTHPAALNRYAGRILLRENPAAARRLFGHSLRLNAFSPATLGWWLAAAMYSVIVRRSP